MKKATKRILPQANIVVDEPHAEGFDAHQLLLRAESAGAIDLENK